MAKRPNRSSRPARASGRLPALVVLLPHDIQRAARPPLPAKDHVTAEGPDGEVRILHAKRRRLPRQSYDPVSGSGRARSTFLTNHTRCARAYRPGAVLRIRRVAAARGKGLGIDVDVEVGPQREAHADLARQSSCGRRSKTHSAARNSRAGRLSAVVMYCCTSFVRSIAGSTDSCQRGDGRKENERAGAPHIAPVFIPDGRRPTRSIVSAMRARWQSAVVAVHLPGAA